MPTTPLPGKIACPHCQGLIKTPALATGSAVNCPKCGQAFRLGQAPAVSVPSPQPKVQGQPAENRGQKTTEAKRTKDDGRKIAPGLPQPPPPPPGSNPKSQIPNSESPQTSSKPKKPDNLVDPNLLPPPPPKVKEKPKDVAVVCQLCGTRVYVKIEKIGQEVKCPDCHSRNLVVGPKEAGAAKAKGPTLDGTENYGMSEVVDRPKYRPLQSARGEYEVLSALDPAAIEQRMTVPDDKPRKKKLVAAPAADQSGEPDEDHGELTLEAPVERAEAARDPRTVLPQPEFEDENTLYDGRYDDGVLGDGVDPRKADAWKKAPLVYGIVDFLFRPNTLLRWLMFSGLLAVAAGLLKWAITLILAGGSGYAYALAVMWAGIPVAGVFVLSFAAAFHAIVEATGNGGDEVATWPDWNVFGWFAPAFFVLIAAVAAAVPGGLIGATVLAASFDEAWVRVAGICGPPLLSMLIFFPMFYCSMLIEDNLFAFLSGYTLRSLKIAGDAWIFSYMYAVLLALLGIGAVATAAAANFLFTAVGAAATVAVLIIYARLLGRLMWVAAQRDAKYSG